MTTIERPAEEELVGRVQELTAQVEAFPDPQARACAEELAAAVVQLYGEGLERIFAALDEDERAQLAQDGVVASLMLIHGLHPVSLEARVQEALDSVRPYMDSHGGNVELLGIEAGVVRLGLQGSCKTCPSSSMTLKLAIEEAICKEAPDVASIEAEGVAAEQAPAPSNGFVQIGKRPASVAAALSST